MRSVPCRCGGRKRDCIGSSGFRMSIGSTELRSESRIGEFDGRSCPRECVRFFLPLILAGMMGKAEGPSVRIGATDRKVRRRRC